MCTVLGTKTDWLYPLLIRENEENKIKFMQFLCYYVKTLSAKEQQNFGQLGSVYFARATENGESQLENM